MPIKPENRKRYPPNWLEIRALVQSRARNACEGCGIGNHMLGGRTRDGVFCPAIPDQYMARLRWPAPGTENFCWNGERAVVMRIIRIVCTVAHVDHQPENCDPGNLAFWCQRCHLRHDATLHQQHAFETRRAGMVVRDLFEELGHQPTHSGED